MKRKTFKEYLKTRLSSEEITEIKEQALQEKNSLETAKLVAIKMVVIDHVTAEMKKKKSSEAEMAKYLGISGAAFMRLLNPQDFSVTLLTLYRIAAVLGKKLEIKFH
jgi:antitoxin HicB